MNYTRLLILIKRMVALLAIFSVCRILFYAFNHTYFSGLGFGAFSGILFHGIYFDVSTVILLNFLFIFLFILPFPFRDTARYNSFLKGLFITVINGAGGRWARSMRRAL